MLKPLAIVATIPDDAHIWNLTSVQLRLQERGFDVVNLGNCTPPEILAQAIQRYRPPLVVVSTINGHGVVSGVRVADVLASYQAFRTTTIVIGGMLGTNASAGASARRRLLDAGFHAVFDGIDSWTEFDAFLEASSIQPLLAMEVSDAW